MAELTSRDSSKRDVYEQFFPQCHRLVDRNVRQLVLNVRYDVSREIKIGLCDKKNEKVIFAFIQWKRMVARPEPSIRMPWVRLQSKNIYVQGRSQVAKENNVII